MHAVVFEDGPTRPCAGTEPYPPVQEYHQQQHPHQHPRQHQPQHQQQHPSLPLSPAHPAHHPYPPYGPRDPPKNRDPAGDQRQSNSTGHAPEGTSSTPHLPPASLPPPPPPGAYSDNSRHMNYDSAPSMPPTPGCYRAPSYPPPIPVPHQASYEQHRGYAYSSSVPAKKKNKRTFPDISAIRRCQNPGDISMLRLLGGGRNPQVASAAGGESLPCDEESPDEEARVHDDPRGAFSPTTRYFSTNRVTLSLIDSSSGHLPPIHGVHAPVGESKETLPSQSLPSLRSTFGEPRDLAPEHLPQQELGRVPSGPSSTFPSSTAGNIGHCFSVPSFSSQLCSPPEGHRAHSPHSNSSASIHYYTKHSTHPRALIENSSSNNAAETPSTDHSVSTPATSTSINSASITDRMSLDGTTHPQDISDSYKCKAPGCPAKPFRSQYLLDSHTNVHLSLRLHFCREKGCKRSEGGEGFKRKNEMIRHSLVHASPEYVCPYCPNKKHKYPRPDSLQRHVRVHHPDKDKDDTQLRDVLDQRSDGSKGRRKTRQPPG